MDSGQSLLCFSCVGVGCYSVSTIPRSYWEEKRRNTTTKQGRIDSQTLNSPDISWLSLCCCSFFIFPSCHYLSPHMLFCSFELGSLNICGLLTQAGGKPEVLTESENFLFPLREKLKRSESGVISEALCCFFRVGGAQYAHHKEHKPHLCHDWASSPPSPMRQGFHSTCNLRLTFL